MANDIGFHKLLRIDQVYIPVMLPAGGQGLWIGADRLRDATGLRGRPLLFERLELR
jgi:hypothetical protein